MTPKAQQIAIAKVCGWTDFHYRLETHLFGIAPFSVPSGGPVGVPNYPADLNAMHEAEKVLLARRGNFTYLEVLHEVTSKQGIGFSQAMVCATAAQRCEAFLRTLNLWTE